MLDYKKEYERWLASDALSADEKAELKSIAGDEMEIESRFYGPLEFGTAGLRGTMKRGSAPDERPRDPLGHPGLRRRDLPPRATRLSKSGVAICMDCREPQHGLRPRRGGGLRRQRHPGAHVRVPAPHAGAELRRAVLRLSGGHQRHRQPQSQGIQRLQGLLGGRRAAAAPARRRHRPAAGED